MSDLDKDMHVVVLMGGWSAEREVSLSSGEGVVRALEARGWSNVTPVDMDRNVARVIAELRPDVVFNALHGSPGEDGTVQGMLDLMQIPYTHSGCTTSAVAIDKQLTKAVLEPHGIPMPPGRIVTSESLYDAEPMPRPFVLKPVDEGSSVGVAIVTDEFGPITRETEGPWQQFDRLLCEEFIAGHELTVAVLGEEALEVTELKIASGWYDYAHKYEEGQTVHVCPAEVPGPVAERMKHLALEAHRLLGCRGCSRSDFRWDEERGLDGLFLLETNTQPGMTPLSLVPEQARARGIDYGELCERLIAEAFG
ncbi:D-alanine--D-alanine ligase [Sphingomicrobium astaxanthinifaciens]|uniref:D-alanine--D-alanine ligase n=1 Tax=Sphingomicrobium astaxanthinifaciens TaxID=1227949 RepID=UPI001FCA93D7|nr:D-alanine--D-alanine ligase [Sphingomicrobium astaxanthinifaciens]MCJ7421642.1 D-alanine--D-alanine ligase [Sphingomicrobium astaxanthinifaciens]